MICPVTYEASSDNKKEITFAISYGFAILFKEVLETTSSMISFLVFLIAISVLVKPGAMAFTLILKFPNSLDITLDIEFKADFDEAYEPLPKSPSIDDVDDTKTILPDFFLSINFTICCVKYT